jgi:tripartite ATP-independent transporter DctP family solute receptor
MRSIPLPLRLLALAAAAMFAAAPVAAQTKKQIKLAHSSQASLDSELHQAATVFEQEIAKTAPTLEVKIYAANALGQERDVYEAMQLGSGATCAISGTAILTNFNKRLGVLDLPFMWRDYDHTHKVLDGAVGTTLSKELEGNGFKTLVWLDSWGYRNVITAKKPVNKPEDLKGLKIRTIPTPLYVAALNAMGANATPMAFGEVYNAMQTGVLDGFEHSAAMTYANKFYEVAKYGALTRHLFGPVIFTCSMKEWQKFTPDEQKSIQAAANKARDNNRELAPIREKEAFDGLKAKGMTFVEVDTTGFRQAAVKVQDDLAKERGATDLLETIRTTK